MNDVRSFLHSLPAFARFQERHLDVLVGQLRIEDHEAGHCFVAQDTQGAATYIVISGVVDITRRDPVAGNERDEVREARDGEIFGLLSLVDDMPSPETSTARGPVRVAALTPDRYRALFLLAPGVAHQLQYMVAVQLARDLQEKNKSLREGLVRKRPASLLERLFGG